jgi:hypothetical protein
LPPTFLTYHENISPHEGLRGTGAAAETLSAKRGDWTLRRNGSGDFGHLRAVTLALVSFPTLGQTCDDFVVCAPRY